MQGSKSTEIKKSTVDTVERKMAASMVAKLSTSVNKSAKSMLQSLTSSMEVPRKMSPELSLDKTKSSQVFKSVVDISVTSVDSKTVADVPSKVSTQTLNSMIQQLYDDTTTVQTEDTTETETTPEKVQESEAQEVVETVPESKTEEVSETLTEVVIETPVDVVTESTTDVAEQSSSETQVMEVGTQEETLEQVVEEVVDVAEQVVEQETEVVIESADVIEEVKTEEVVSPSVEESVEESVVEEVQVEEVQVEETKTEEVVESTEQESRSLTVVEGHAEPSVEETNVDDVEESVPVVEETKTEEVVVVPEETVEVEQVEVTEPQMVSVKLSQSKVMSTTTSKNLIDLVSKVSTTEEEVAPIQVSLKQSIRKSIQQSVRMSHGSTLQRVSLRAPSVKLVSPVVQTSLIPESISEVPSTSMTFDRFVNDAEDVEELPEGDVPKLMVLGLDSTKTSKYYKKYFDEQMQTINSKLYEVVIVFNNMACVYNNLVESNPEEAKKYHKKLEVYEKVVSLFI